MTPLLGLIGKDILELRRDRLALALTIVLPALSLVMFGYGIRLQSHNIPLVVFDYDHTTSSRSFVDAFVASNVFQVRDPQASESADMAVRHGCAALILPDDFSSKLSRSEQPVASLFIDGTELNQARTTELAFSSICDSFLRKPTLASYYVIPKIVSWFNPGLHEELFIVPGTLAVLLWMFPSLLAAVAMARELERSAVVQPYVAKVPAAVFVGAKMLVYVIVGMLQAVLLFLLSWFIFKLPVLNGSFMFAVSTLLYIDTAVLFGIAIGALCRSQTAAVQAASTGGFFPCLLLSGFVYPLDNIPQAIQVVSYLVPARYYMQAVRDAFVQDSGQQAYLNTSLILIIFACSFFAISWFALRKMHLQELN